MNGDVDDFDLTSGNSNAVSFYIYLIVFGGFYLHIF